MKCSAQIFVMHHVSIGEKLDPEKESTERK